MNQTAFEQYALDLQNLVDKVAIKYPEEGEIDDEKRLTSEFLIGFTYIPGTVVYFGYGARHENLIYDGKDYILADTFKQFFFLVPGVVHDDIADTLGQLGIDWTSAAGLSGQAS